jgi:hypothetical protein
LELGPYRIAGEIGRGGMGIVFRAVGPEGTQVAVKLMRPGAGPEAALRLKLQREAPSPWRRPSRSDVAWRTRSRTLTRAASSTAT